MENAKPVEGNTAQMANVKLALSFGIVFGIGLISGWYLTASGFFG